MWLGVAPVVAVFHCSVDDCCLQWLTRRDGLVFMKFGKLTVPVVIAAWVRVGHSRREGSVAGRRICSAFLQDTMLHELHDALSKNKRYKCKAPCCSGFTYSLDAPCTLCGKPVSMSGASEITPITAERRHMEQVGSKRRLVEISVSISDNSCTFPLAVVSLGKTSVFDAKEKLCTITSVFVPLSVKSDEVEEILFCEPLRVIFLILNVTSMNRVSASLGVNHHCKDDKKRRVVIVLEEKPLQNPFDCSAISHCLTSPQLEAFCTNVRLTGGVSMTDVKPSTAQSILVAFGLRLTRNHPNEIIHETSAVDLSGNTLSDCSVIQHSSSMSVAPHPGGAGDSDDFVILSDDESDCENDDNNDHSSNIAIEPNSTDEAASINGKGSFVYHPPGSKDGILLTEADVDCLSPGVFLNDTIINFYLKYLYFEQFSPMQRHATHLFNSFFYSRLCSVHCDTSLSPESADEDLRMSRHAAVANWTRRVDIFTKDYIIIPINENLHWFLGLVCYPWMVGMVSYTKLYADYSFDQCRLIPDFADTNNVEASFGDVSIEEVETLPTDERGEAFDRWRRRRLAWLRGRGINAMPCILLFDSISAQQRIGNLHIIRNYLQAEWDVRRRERDGDMLFNKDTVRGFSPRVPEAFEKLHTFKILWSNVAIRRCLLKVVVLDIRSFREYHTSHICSALNLGGNRAFKRRLLDSSHALGPFLSLLVGVTVENLHSFKKIILYDQRSTEQPTDCSDNFTHFIINGTADLFSNAVLLQGGFIGFCAEYPDLCWQHPDKLPDEEFVGVKGDSGLENLLQECLFKLYHETPPKLLSPGERSSVSTRQPSSCSSCGSSSSQQSTDSGVVLAADLAADTALIISRKTIPRVTSAPTNRPTTVVTSLSVDDVIMAGSCRRPLRLRPNTLSLCSSSYSPSTSAATSTCSTLLDNSSRCHFTSSYRLLYPSNSASVSTLSPASTQPPRPASTVSAALSAEAFESPLPTAVMPHLLIGCQADAMSAKVCAEFGVTHVINVSADGETSPHVPPSRFLRIPIHDNGRADMVPYFERAFAFLDSAKDCSGRVLIHCFAGISRSPTLAIAYLMHDQRITFDEAYNRVKAMRPKISPNFNFIGQLTDFERRLNLPSPSQPPPQPPVIIVPTPAPTRTATPLGSSRGVDTNSEVAPRIIHHMTSTVTISTRTSSLSATPGPSRPVTLSLRRPLMGGCSKKRDRSQYLSFYTDSPSEHSTPSVETSVATAADVPMCITSTSTSTTNAVAFVGRRKRSRFGPLLPSPSTAIASLDLSSPSEDCRLPRLKSTSPPPPPPSPRPRRLRRGSPLRIEEARRFSLSTFSELQFAGAALAAAAAAAAAAEAPSSDIDSEIDIAASNPTIIGSGGGLQSPNASAHRWIIGESCRHQQATAESSCHSSLSSSSNSQHTPSFPIS
ncbi:Sentrin-specific protease 7 [Taenia crassiceps]|uniref:protein-tyrosine-phosphatase n=1 Tax=Taenia crassiceps TaxID=6207 RepID=A0ABR4Q756_9CEST